MISWPRFALELSFTNITYPKYDSVTDNFLEFFIHDCLQLIKGSEFRKEDILVKVALVLFFSACDNWTPLNQILNLP